MRFTLNAKIMVGISVFMLGAMTWHLMRHGMHREFEDPQWGVVGGDPARGESAIEAHACASCHQISGIRTDKNEGPDLRDFRRQMFIADTAANTPEDLVGWLQEHSAKVSHSSKVTEQEARDLASYLYTVK